MKTSNRVALITLLFVAAMVLFSSACGTYPIRSQTVTFVLIRHAETAPDGTKDPPLSALGVARAHALAATLPGDVNRVYATDYRRTQQTARIVADANAANPPVNTYDASLPAEQFAKQLGIHIGGTVVVVGHSNTIPAIASALCHCAVAPMREDEFDRRITIRIRDNGNGAISIEESRYR